MSSPDALERAFLDDIVAHPDDPALWLILADWLEDRADPRAELVRLTWSLTHEADDPEFLVRQARVQSLLAGGLRPIVPRQTLAHGIEVAWIPPGSGVIGSPDGEPQRDGDEARHQVTITRGFWLGVYPVTQGQWRAIRGSNPSDFSREGESAALVADLSEDEVDRLPVECVSWHDAVDFLGRLRARLGRTARLPTEAEWEYACRAGTTTVFSFGDVTNGRQANLNGKHPYGAGKRGRALGRTTVVGSYPPNPWGLYDVHGNVGEWVQDSFRVDYEALPATDPVHDEANAHRRVFRGGSWDQNPIYCRSAYRNHVGPAATANNVGLRVLVE